MPAVARREEAGPRVRVVDPADVYRRHVHGRAVVYLDTSLWIDLAWAATPEAKRCLALCRREREQGNVIFPLSNAAVGELIEQTVSEDLHRRAALMDELSEGVCLRAVELVYAAEALAALPALFGNAASEPDRAEMFTYVVSRFGDFSLDYPAKVPEGFVDAMTGYVRDHVWMRSVSWLLTRESADDSRIEHEAILAKHRQRSIDAHQEEARHARDADGKVNFARALRNQRVGSFMREVWPAMAKLFASALPSPVVEQVVRAIEAKGGLGRKGLARVFRAMPAADLHCELFARRAANPTRRYRDSDFWDIEHARVAPAYAHAFASLDGELVATLRNCDTPRQRGCSILGSTAELAAWLEQHAERVRGTRE